MSRRIPDAEDIHNRPLPFLVGTVVGSIFFAVVGFAVIQGVEDVEQDKRPPCDPVRVESVEYKDLGTDLDWWEFSGHVCFVMAEGEDGDMEKEFRRYDT